VNYSAAGSFPGRFFTSLIFGTMVEILVLIVSGLIAVIISEIWLDGVLNVLNWFAYRTYSIFTGEWNVSLDELREKYKDSMWPWVLLSCSFGVLLRLILSI